MMAMVMTQTISFAVSRQMGSVPFAVLPMLAKWIAAEPVPARRGCRG